MTISWANSDGQTGIAEDAYEFAMQHQVNTKTKTDREELPPQERINQAFGEGPTPELKDQNAPNSWGMGEEMKSLGTLPDAPDAEWEKAYGLGSFKPRLIADVNEQNMFPRHHGEAILPPEAFDTKIPFDQSLKAYSKGVDDFAVEKGMRPEDTFSVTDPGRGSILYKYLGSDKQKHGAEFNFMEVKPIVPSDKVSSIHEQLQAFQQRLDNTPPEEAGAFRKFLGSLNIMPAPGKPESEWTAKEHLGVMLNQAMAGMGGGFKAPPRGPVGVVPPKTVVTPAIEQLAKYEELSSQGKTTKQIVKGSKLAPEQVREALGRDNLAIAAFNSENALTNAYFKSLENLDPALGEALKKQVSVKDLKRYTRGLPEDRLKTIFEELPSHVKEAFESGEQRRINIDTGKKSKVIPKPLK